MERMKVTPPIATVARPSDLAVFQTMNSYIFRLSTIVHCHARPNIANTVEYLY